MTHNFEDLCWEALDWVGANAANFGGYVDLAIFTDAYGIDPQGARGLFQFGMERGLLSHSSRSPEALEVCLTSTGANLLRARQAKRDDPILRAAAVRRAILEWLWRLKREGAKPPLIDHFLGTDGSRFEGTSFLRWEIERAVAYLLSKGLIEKVGEVRYTGIFPQFLTTWQGDDCVEQYGGDVDKYERRNDQASGPVFHIGSNSGNIAANSRDFTMSASVVNGVDPSQIVMFARALRQAAPVLGLPEAEIQELMQTADRLEQEAGDGEPDPSRVQRWGSVAIGILNSPIVSGALGSVLASYGVTVLPGTSGA
ncbi:hypothetical protein [Spirillospora sp. CA-128828]|uniref:hypothetical protein n=1 Tax=Spirillospora sp. CA-128828 TaxID=3240033 RepID=UPI003D8BF64F